jgi:glycolate oxidase FAD binding subunit
MMSDNSQQLANEVKEAFENKSPLSIHGMKSKSFLRYQDEGTALNTMEHTGIIAYEPTELVVTVRAGTPIQTLQSILAEQNQTLVFDPPRFHQKGSVGGAVATGLSGPSRPWDGAIRDHVLGAKIINGKGEILNFGGQVMKNVAGYDVSRLMTGAFGTLGVLLDITFKVLPLSEKTTTLSFECDAQDAIDRVNAWTSKAVPVNGAYWSDNVLYLRLSGTTAGVNDAVATIGGDEIAESESLWPALRDHDHVFFTDNEYWRLSVPPATPMLTLQGEWLIDWGGAQRWLKTSEPHDKILQVTSDANGHAEQWHSQDKNYLRAPLDPTVNRYHQNLKDAFDPTRILNSGTFYPDL